ncbi:MAG TPA: hypothetical protein VGM01_01940 [Ktedonobacteraceae bacterium]|jgi:hypothetical protein
MEQIHEQEEQPQSSGTPQPKWSFEGFVDRMEHIIMVMARTWMARLPEVWIASHSLSTMIISLLIQAASFRRHTPTMLRSA